LDHARTGALRVTHKSGTPGWAFPIVALFVDPGDRSQGFAEQAALLRALMLRANPGRTLARQRWPPRPIGRLGNPAIGLLMPTGPRRNGKFGLKNGLLIVPVSIGADENG